MMRLWRVWLVALVLSLGSVSAAQADEASQFIESIGNEVVTILGDKSKNDVVKESDLRTLFQKHVDVDWIGKFVLGKYWRSASPTQQQRYLEGYRGFVIKSYTSKFKEYTGSESFKIRGTTTDAQGRNIVTMELLRPGEASVMVDYKIRKEDKELRIFDIVVEGVSLITTQRSEFASVVSRKGLDYLIEQLNKRAQG